MITDLEFAYPNYHLKPQDLTELLRECRNWTCFGVSAMLKKLDFSRREVWYLGREVYVEDMLLLLSRHKLARYVHMEWWGGPEYFGPSFQWMNGTLAHFMVDCLLYKASLKGPDVFQIIYGCEWARGATI